MGTTHMLHFTIPGILSLLTTYGYVIIFPVSVVEGPLIGVVAGFLVGAGKLNGLLVFLVLVVGDVAGDYMYYALGRWGGRRMVDRWGAYVGIKTETVLRFEKYFKKNDAKIILIGKTQPVGAAILVSAGMVRSPLGRFLWFNLLGTIPKALLFECAGIFLGTAIFKADTYIAYISEGSFILGVILIASYFIFRRYLSNKI